MSAPITLVILDLDTPRYFSDGFYVSRSTDAIGLKVFDSRLVGDITFERSITTRLWSNRNATSGLGAIELINNDRALDALAWSEAVKRKRVWIYTGNAGDAFDNMTLAASARIDRIEPVGERSIKVITTSVLMLLEAAIQTVLYDSGDDVAGEMINRPRPIAIGHPKSCPIPLVDAIDYEYDCHDDADWRDVTMVRDGGYPLTEGTGYRRAITAGRFGIEKLALPTGRVVADVRGASATTEIIGETPGDFASGLTGWSTSVTGDGACTASGGGCQISGGAAGTAKIFIDNLLNAGSTYRWSIASATRTSGELVILSGTDVVATLTASGAASGYFTAEAAGLDPIVPFGIAKGAAAASWLIDGVRLERLDEHALIGDVVRYIVNRSATLTDTDIDTASLDALETACPWPLSLWIDSTARIRDVLQSVVDSVAGFMYENRLGQLAFGRPTRPADGTSGVTITRDLLVEGTDVRMTPDDAPGFSRIVNGGRNWYRYQSGEVVDGVSDADRTLITTDYRVRGSTATAVNDEIEPIALQFTSGRLRASSPSTAPSDATEADIGLGTLLDAEADCQTLADHISSLYPTGERQRFYTIDAYLTPAQIESLEPWSIVTLQLNAFGLDAGVKLALVSIKGAVGKRRAELTLWGAPEVTP